MCDTILATPPSTAQRLLLFGKNSDRQRNEAQTVEVVAHADHGRDARLACTYITIPQVPRTHTVLLCRPFWTWGAEMGANEFGVAIGNEGLHARIPAPEVEALTGMDLVRLALERAVDAAQAVDVITELLTQHGQGGNCGYPLPDYYHNSFMIADPHDAFVLETVGREWVVERVVSVRSLSNAYSIRRGALRASDGMMALTRASGADPHPSFADLISNPTREHVGHAHTRSARSSELLRSNEGSLEIADMMRILRDHGAEGGNPDWHPQHAPARTICMHAAGEDRRGQTVGSLACELAPSKAVHWVTGTAAPCISIFKPVRLGVPLPPQGTRPTGHFDARALWWRHERLHRAMLGDFGAFLADIRKERDALESGFRTRIRSVLAGGTDEEQAQVVTACWEEARAVEDRWILTIRMVAEPREGTYWAAWEAMDGLAGIPTLDR